MFNLDLFLKQLENMYSKSPSELEKYLTDGVESAKSNGDKGATLVILNELMGFYRVTSKFELCEKCVDEVLALSKDLGIGGTANYGTVLLNVATACRVMKRYADAEKYYNQVEEIFSSTLGKNDYRIATLHNNLSLLYSETDRLPQAKQQLALAMDTIVQLDNAEIEIAITHINMGNLCFSLCENDEGAEHMKNAVDIFEKNNATDDSHYASALSGLAQAYFYLGDLDSSSQYYKKALEEIERHYGKNEYYNVTKENLDLVVDTLDRKNAVLNQKLNGIEISKLYYKAYGEPMLKAKYADYYDKITVGLVGEGSECFGFDDEYSTDHDFGPSFCMWVDSDVFDEIGEDLANDYNALPKSYMGFKARNTIATGLGRVGALKTEDFYKNILGFDLPTTDEQWHLIPQEYLATATNGEIFKAGTGKFDKIRNQIAYYPKNVRLQKLAIALGKMSQTGQANYPRMIKRGDLGSAQLCINEFVRATIECVYLLNGKYAPYYKWQFRGMDELKSLGEAKPLLLELMATSTADTKINQLVEQICRLIMQELNAQSLSASKDTYLENKKNEVLNKIYE
jgi:tetratricopeptide (TPR) repeat protein